jgi:hypothetical protein
MLKKDNARVEWVQNNAEVRTWLERLAVKSRQPYLSNAFAYFTWLRDYGGEYANKSLKELFDLQDMAVGRDRFKQLRLLQRFISEKKVAYATMCDIYSSVRSLYAYNLVELPKDVTFRMHSPIQPATSVLDVEGLKRILGVANQCYRACFAIMFQSGMGDGEFEIFNNQWSIIRSQLEEKKEIIKIPLPGRKHSRNRQPYYTLLASKGDAVRAMTSYLESERGAIGDGDPIFVSNSQKGVNGDTLRDAFNVYSERAGIIKRHTPKCPICGGETIRKRRRVGVAELGFRPQRVFYRCKKCKHDTFANQIDFLPHQRYGANPHEMRDVFRSEWHLSRADPDVAEFIMGHDIDKNRYDKIMTLHLEYAEDEYRKALPFLNILSEDPRKLPLDKVRALEEKTQEIDELKRRMAGMEQQIQGWKKLAAEMEQLTRYVQAKK